MNLAPINTDIDDCTEPASTIQLAEDQQLSKQNLSSVGPDQDAKKISFTDKRLKDQDNPKFAMTRQYLLRNYKEGNYAKNIKNARRKSGNNDHAKGLTVAPMNANNSKALFDQN